MARHLTTIAIPLLTGVALYMSLHDESIAQDGKSGDNRFKSMPFDTSPYLAPPLVYGEWHGTNVAFKTSPELVRRLLPAPLIPDATPWGATEGDVMLITQCQYNLAEPLSITYRCTSLMIPATLNGKLGLYEVRVYEDGEDPTLLTIWGREIWGFPKLAGKTQVTRKERHANSSLRAFGATSIDVASNAYRRQSHRGCNGMGPLLQKDNSIAGKPSCSRSGSTC